MKALRISLILFLFLSYSSNLFAQSPFQFLRYVSGARAAGLSGAFVSMTNDATALFFNPATISTVEEKPVSITFLKHVEDINSGNATYIIPTEEDGILAGSINYTNYGSFQYADKFGNRNGRTFGGNDLSMGVSYSNNLDTRLYYGVTLKFLYMNLEQYSSTAVAVDVGILYRLPDDRTNIGVSVLHSGTQLSTLDGVREDLPTDIRAGINHRLRGLPLLMNFTFHHLADQENDFFSRFRNFSIGGELQIGKYIQLRLGYDNQVRIFASPTADKGLSGISGGLGIKVNELNFDFALARYGSAATLQRFSLSFDI